MAEPSNSSGRRRGKPPEFKLVARKDLSVLYHLQRTPRDDRVRKMREHWDESKRGVLLVARISEGPHKGVLHVYEGGTRWAAKDADPNYQFYCVIESMTEKEAAAATFAFNNEQRHHTPYQSYLVGLAAEFPLNLAMRDAFAEVGVEARERSSTRGTIAAIKASERILRDTYTATFAHKDGTLLYPFLDDGERWDIAIERLVAILHLTREAYSDETAHDADMIQAVAALWVLNPEKILMPAVRRRLITKLDEHTVAWYRVKAQEMHETYGGSESRGRTMARIIAMSFNRGLRTPKHALVRPKSKLDDDTLAA